MLCKCSFLDFPLKRGLCVDCNGTTRTIKRDWIHEDDQLTRCLVEWLLYPRRKHSSPHYTLVQRSPRCYGNDGIYIVHQPRTFTFACATDNATCIHIYAHIHVQAIHARIYVPLETRFEYTTRICDICDIPGHSVINLNSRFFFFL